MIRNPAVRRILEKARTQLRDLKYGFPEEELLEPIKVTIDEITALLEDRYDMDSGEIL